MSKTHQPHAKTAIYEGVADTASQILDFLF